MSKLEKIPRVALAALTLPPIFRKSYSPTSLLAQMGEKGHLAYLDGWRGGAILLLLAGHFTLIPNVAGHQIYTGRLGVECFFVLSGRLMAEILFVRKISLEVFYWRRASRILPAMWLFVGSVFLAGWVYPALHVGLGDVAVALSFTANYFIPSEPLEHVWSLCVEEHAYILLGLIAFLQRRYGLDFKQWLIIVSITCATMLRSTGARTCGSPRSSCQLHFISLSGTIVRSDR
jgi:peptidoglycan/LPS O-acetylase OafA/YrhL